MRALDSLRRRFSRRKQKDEQYAERLLVESPLREFAYLDEVSLRSLLSSQLGEVTESMSEQSVSALETEVSAALAANPGFVAKAELASRFQTSNSSTIQTSRKATVQSWFREFHAIPGLRLIQPATSVRAADSLGEVAAVDDASLALEESALRRGALVEFRVTLRADPVFHMGTMLSEFSAMAEDYPDMFGSGDTVGLLAQMQPVNKILQRLLAGLIPIRAVAVDYCVVRLDGAEYVVHKDLLGPLDIERKPLEIVGVTEHLAYWKDIRRVLFSDAEFTLLGRIARPGLDGTWTPVKLADLFQEVAPGLVEQINAASRLPFANQSAGARAANPRSALGEALAAYVDALLAECDATLEAPAREAIAARIGALGERGASVSDQRSAFRAIKDMVMGAVPVELSAERDLELRESARATAGLALFPGLAPKAPRHASTSEDDRAAAGEMVRLLDVEVIALYW